MMQELFLVLGASGAQGGAVARRLVKEGHAVRGFSGRGAELPGVEMIAGISPTCPRSGRPSTA